MRGLVMKVEAERRLHRVMIKSIEGEVKCPHSKKCTHSENCNRCNIYYNKCSDFREKGSTLIN